MIADNNKTDQVKPLGFVSSFIGTCSGTTVFTVLGRHSVLRMLWHLLLLSVLLSFAVTWMGKKNSAPVIAASREIFTSYFGNNILWYPDGAFVPEKSPETARTLLFPGVGKLFYLPQKDGKLPTPAEYAGLSCIGVWTPGEISFAFRNASDSWLVNRINRSGMDFSTTSDAAELFRYAAGKTDGNSVKISCSKLFEEISLAFDIRNWIVHFTSLFILPLIYALLLLVVVKFSFAKVSPQPTYLIWWKCGVYAAFPGALISSAIVAFELPLISFSTAYMLSSMAYGLHAVMRIELEKNPEPEGDNGDQNE